jgi:uncharacterized protein (TIGR03000 family)
MSGGMSGSMRSGMPSGSMRSPATIGTPNRAYSQHGNFSSPGNSARTSNTIQGASSRARVASPVHGGSIGAGTLGHANTWHGNTWNANHWHGNTWNGHAAWHNDPCFHHHGHLFIGFGFYPGLFLGWGGGWGWGWGYPWYDCMYSYSLASPWCGDFYGPIYFGNPDYDVIQPTVPPAPEQLPNMPKGANLEVILPDGSSVVWLDEYRTRSTGLERQYLTPPLEPGRKYTYTVKATWNQDGQVVKEERKVAVSAGWTSVVDFTTPASTSVAKLP